MASMYDYLRVFLMLCIFIAALFRGPRTWIKLQAIGTVLLGVPALIFPGFVLSRLAPGIKADGLHFLVVQSLAIDALGFALFYALASSSKDRMVFSSLLWSSVVSCGIAAYLTSTTHFRDAGKFSDTHLYFLVLGCCILFAVNAWQLFYYWDHARYTFHYTRVNMCLLLDTALCGLSFIYDFCFTSKALALTSQKKEYYHGYFLRLSSTANLGAAVLIAMAIFFSNLRDKKALFQCRIVMCGMFFLCMLLLKLTGNLMPMTWEDVGVYAMAACPGFFSAMGLVFCAEAVRKFGSAERGHYYLRDRRE